MCYLVLVLNEAGDGNDSLPLRLGALELVMILGTDFCQADAAVEGSLRLLEASAVGGEHCRAITKMTAFSRWRNVGRGLPCE